MKRFILGIIIGVTLCIFYYWKDKPYVIHENEINLSKVEMYDLDAKSIDLKTLKDEETYFYFWGTYCAPCVQKLPQLNQFACQEGKSIICISKEDTLTQNNYLDHFDYNCLTFVRTKQNFSEIGIRFIPKMISFNHSGPQLLSKEDIDNFLLENG